MIAGRINAGRIDVDRHWSEILRVVASILTGVTASLIMR
jgi:hypothetical protein